MLNTKISKFFLGYDAEVCSRSNHDFSQAKMSNGHFSTVYIVNVGSINVLLLWGSNVDVSRTAQTLKLKKRYRPRHG